MELHEFFWLLAIILLGARVLSEAAARLGIPSVIGELAAGRGEAGLMFTQVGLSNGILNAALYAALLIVIALTMALPPFALKWIYARWGRDTGFATDAVAPRGTRFFQADIFSIAARNSRFWSLTSDTMQHSRPEQYRFPHSCRRLDLCQIAPRGGYVHWVCTETRGTMR